MRSLAAAVLPVTLALVAVLPTRFVANDAPHATHLTVRPELAEQLAAARPDDVLTVLVTGDRTDDVVTAIERAGLVPREVFRRLGVVAAAGTTSAIHAVHRDPSVRRVDANVELEWMDDVAHRATGVAQLRDSQEHPELHAQRRSGGVPFDGSGVSIAVVDSGFDATHAQFVEEGRTKFDVHLRQACPIPRDALHYALGVDPTPVDCSAWVPATAVDDAHTGHGTITAGTAAAYPRLTPSGARISGTAPGARLVGLAIGAANAMFNSVSALHWILEHHRDPCGDGSCPPIRVVNNSYGLPAHDGATQRRFDPDSPMSRVTAALIQAGVVVVFASGNDAGDGTVNKTNWAALHPLPGMISVGAFDDGKAGDRHGGVPEFSARGQKGDPSTYADLVAPGTHYRIGCPHVGVLCRTFPRDGDAYILASGTSIAAPYVAGVVAQLIEADPTLTPADVENVLEDSAFQGFIAPALLEPDRYRDASGAERGNASHPTSLNAGHGLVDAVAALSAVVNGPDRRSPEPCPQRWPEVRIGDPAGDVPELYSLPAPVPRKSLDIVEVSGSMATNLGALTIRVRLADLAQTDAPTHLSVSGHVDEEYFQVDYDVIAGQPRLDVDSGTVDAAASVDRAKDSITFVVRPRAGTIQRDAQVGWSFTSSIAGGAVSEADVANGACSLGVPVIAPLWW